MRTEQRPKSANTPKLSVGTYVCMGTYENLSLHATSRSFCQSCILLHLIQCTHFIRVKSHCLLTEASTHTVYAVYISTRRWSNIATQTSCSLFADPGVTTDDVLSANKRQTGLKANQFSTDGSRDCECCMRSYVAANIQDEELAILTSNGVSTLQPGQILAS